MRTNSEHISPAKALLIHWSRLCGAAFETARALLLASRCDPRRAAHEAALLETWTRLALFMLLGEIAAIQAGSALTKDDQRALSECQVIVGALAGLCLLCAKVQRGCARRIRTAGRAARLGGCLPAFVNGGYRLDSLAPPHFTLGFFDSG